MQPRIRPLAFRSAADVLPVLRHLPRHHADVGLSSSGQHRLAESHPTHFHAYCRCSHIYLVRCHPYHTNPNLRTCIFFHKLDIKLLCSLRALLHSGVWFEIRRKAVSELRIMLWGTAKPRHSLKLIKKSFETSTCMYLICNDFIGDYQPGSPTYASCDQCHWQITAGVTISAHLHNSMRNLWPHDRQ